MLPDPSQIEKILAERHLTDFIEQAWPVVEPGTRFIGGWHLDAIAEHLQAATPVPVYHPEGKVDERGFPEVIDWSPPQITRLVINIPPRCSKSIDVAVMWPAWVWGPRGLPHVKFMFASYALALSIRDSVKCRNLIRSNWYQRLWGDRFSLLRDQDQKIQFKNTYQGYRLSTSVDGTATGEGGDVIGVDDPINVKEAIRPSSQALKTCLDWWDFVMPTRINNPKIGVVIIIMQRSHVNDLTGHVFERELGFEHLCLPMEYEPETKFPCRTSLNFQDPRRVKGELLVPARFGPKEVANLKKSLGAYGTSGQLQQDPVPKSAGMFDKDNLKIVTGIPSPVVQSVRYWDKAGTDDAGAFTAGVKISKMENGQYIIEHVVRGQWSAPKRESMILGMAEIDGHGVTVWVEQEPGSGGKESAEGTIKNLAGFLVKKEPVTGAKEVRAEPYSIQVEAKNVLVLEGPWNKEFLDEHQAYPVGKYKDQVDAAAGGFNKLTAKGKKAGMGWA